MSLVALLLIDKFDRKPNDLYGVLYLLTQYVGVLQCSRLLNEIELIARLESLIESFIELMSQVFMLPIFHRRTSC